MESDSHEKSSFDPKHLLSDHNKYKKDENEKKLFDFISNTKKFKIKSYEEHNKEVSDFLSSKQEAMEKINLDDECFENESQNKKIEIDKNVFRKSKHSKSKKDRNYSKKTNKYNKKSSSKKSSNSSIYKNIIINHNGKIFRTTIERIDTVDVLNFDIEKEIKEKELKNFFSDRFSLSSIINEMMDE